MQLCKFARATKNTFFQSVLSARLGAAASYVSCAIELFKENRLVKSLSTTSI